jgi:hypothetical protein
MIVDYNLTFVDFNKSTFVVTKDSIIKRDELVVKIASLEDYKHKKALLGKREVIKLTNVYLVNSFIENGFDLFKIPQLSSSWIISDLLKEALLSNNISGIAIREVNQIAVVNRQQK